MPTRRIPLNSGERRRLLVSRPTTKTVVPPELPENSKGKSHPLLTIVDRAPSVIPFTMPKQSKTEQVSDSSLVKRYGLTPYPAQSGPGSRAQMRRIRTRNLQLF